jgi:hypothetical protein
MTFRAAHRRGLISYDTRAVLERISSRLNFRDRTLERVLAEAKLVQQNLSDTEWPDLLRSVFVEQKKTDALRALAFLRRDRPTVPVNTTVTLTATFAAELDEVSPRL